MRPENVAEKLNGLQESQLPLVSLITVVFNGARYLEEAMQSVFNQTYPKIEYIVIDGGSTDGTLDIIRIYAGSIDYWVSEPDLGIYDAMNKGIKVAAGEIIGLVNADDALYPDAVERVVSSFLSLPEVQFVYGPVDLMDGHSTITGRSNALPDDEIFWRRKLEMPFAHPSCFVSRQVYQEIGMFDLSFPIAADYDFIWRMMDYGFRGVRMDQPAAMFRIDGISHGYASFVETRRLHKKYDIPCWQRNRIFAFSLVKWFLISHLPRPVIRFLKRFRRKSRHTFCL